MEFNDSHSHDGSEHELTTDSDDMILDMLSDMVSGIKWEQHTVG